MTQCQNSQLSPDEIIRLNQLDFGLRNEADEFLADSGLGQIINDAGFKPVGSYCTHTMTWRDLDFECMVDSPNLLEHWALGQELAKTGWVWLFSCRDAYRDQSEPGDFGYYWGIRASRPSGGPIWKLDLWTARPSEFAYGLERRATWQSLMTEDARLQILAIKDAVCTRPEYRKKMLSIHIYEAVLEKNITALDAFLEWWHSSYEEQE